MKTIVSVLAITVVAALALTGCGQSNSSDSAYAPATNSSMVDTNGLGGVNTNLPVTNSLPDVYTNPPATNSLPEVNTNLPPGTNQ